MPTRSIVTYQHHSPTGFLEERQEIIAEAMYGLKTWGGHFTLRRKSRANLRGYISVHRYFPGHHGKALVTRVDFRPTEIRYEFVGSGPLVRTKV